MLVPETPLRGGATDGGAECKCWKAVVLRAAESLHNSSVFSTLPLQRTIKLTPTAPPPTPTSLTRHFRSSPSGIGSLKVERSDVEAAPRSAAFVDCSANTNTQPSATHKEISNVTSELLNLMEGGGSVGLFTAEGILGGGGEVRLLSESSGRYLGQTT